MRNSKSTTNVFEDDEEEDHERELEADLKKGIFHKISSKAGGKFIL
jgi:hypothetical protein